MKTNIRVAIDVRNLINVPAVISEITGRIWLFTQNNRTGPRETTDIVVKTLNIDNKYFQEGDVNVNVYAPNLRNSGQPDMIFYDRMLGILLPLLDVQYKESFSTEVDIPGDLIRDSDGAWFLMIRLIYRSYNSEYTNI